MLREPDRVLEALQALDDSCAVMLELKSIYGNFYYSTAIDGAATADVDVARVDEIISYLRSRGFYMIAEIPAFCDSAFALDNQSSGLPLSSGALWMDENACYWLDPASQTVLSYLTQIARELSSLGFREIAFSEFRFPSSQNIAYSSEKNACAADSGRRLPDNHILNRQQPDHLLRHGRHRRPRLRLHRQALYPGRGRHKGGKIRAGLQLRFLARRAGLPRQFPRRPL